MVLRFVIRDHRLGKVTRHFRQDFVDIPVAPLVDVAQLAQIAS